MNKKGQALVEFIIILPIFIMIMLAAFDFVKILQTRSNLESIIEEIILDEDYSLNEKYLLKTETDNNIITYKLSTDVEMVSPLVTLVTGNPYKVMVERSIYAK